MPLCPVSPLHAQSVELEVDRGAPASLGKTFGLILPVFRSFEDSGPSCILRSPGCCVPMETSQTETSAVACFPKSL